MNQGWINPKIEILPTPAKGKGMFALEKITKGETIFIWFTEFLNSEQLKKLDQTNKLIMQWDDDMFSCEVPGVTPDYFINHSCEPNTWMKDAATVIAKNKIQQGQEITIDYGLFESEPNQILDWKCQCGEPSCRGHVSGDDWKLLELQKKYKGHFSPLLNKRIKNLY